MLDAPHRHFFDYLVFDLLRDLVAECPRVPLEKARVHSLAIYADISVEEDHVCLDKLEVGHQVLERTEFVAVRLKREGIGQARLRIDDNPFEHELLAQHIKCVGLLSKLLEAYSFPLLDNFIVYFQECYKTSTVVLCDELMEQPLDEELESHSLGHITKKDEVIALTDNWDVVLFDGRGLWQVSH